MHYMFEIYTRGQLVTGPLYVHGYPNYVLTVRDMIIILCGQLLDINTQRLMLSAIALGVEPNKFTYTWVFWLMHAIINDFVRFKRHPSSRVIPSAKMSRMMMSASGCGVFPEDAARRMRVVRIVEWHASCGQLRIWQASLSCKPLRPWVVLCALGELCLRRGRTMPRYPVWMALHYRTIFATQQFLNGSASFDC